MLRTRYALALVAVLLVACGEGPTETTLQVTPAVIEVLAGDSQVDTVLHQLPEAIEARVLDDEGNPMPGIVVSYRTFTPPDYPSWAAFDCGHPQASSLETNSEGVTSNPWTLGEGAWTSLGGDCGMEVVASIDGRPVVFDTALATALPGPIHYVIESGTKMSISDSWIQLDPYWATDEIGNPGLWRFEADSVVSVRSTEYGTRDAWALTAERNGDAAVCGYDQHGAAIFPTLVEVTGLPDSPHISVETQGGAEGTSQGQVQLEDC